MGIMFPYYSLLSMKVIWLNMVTAPPAITMGRLNLQMFQNSVVTKSFLQNLYEISSKLKIKRSS